MHQFYISFNLFSSIGKFEAFWIPFGITPNKAPPWIFCFFFFHKKITQQMHRAFVHIVGTENYVRLLPLELLEGPTLT